MEPPTSASIYRYTAQADRRAKLIVAPGWIQTEMGGLDATFTVEECIPLVVDVLEKNHGKAGLRYVDRGRAVMRLLSEAREKV